MAEATPNQMRIFVSHSHKDDDACHALVAALRDAGADVWYDEHNMRSGRLGPAIEKEIQERPVFVLVASPAALASRWVEDETRWAYGLSRNDEARILLPVLCEPVKEDDIWLFLRDFKRIEGPGLTPYPEEERIRQMVRALALTQQGSGATTITPQSGESGDDLLTRGRGLIAQGKYAEALPFFQCAIQETDAFDAWTGLGRTFNALGRPGDGLIACTCAAALNPEYAPAWFGQGTALAELGHQSEALAAYNRALAIDPEYAVAYHNKGNTLAALHRHQEALEAYERALALNPDYPTAWNGMGNELRELGRTEEALVAYDHATSADSEIPLFWRLKARLLSELDRVDEAAEAERRAKELSG